MNAPEDYEGITLFAAIKTFYESGSDILSAICSLVLVTIDDGESIVSISKHFRDEYQVTIPTAALQTILKRLKRSGYIQYSAHFTAVQMTDAGKNEATKLNSSVKGLKRDFSALVKNLKGYFNQHGYPVLTDPERALLSFIDANLGYTSLALTASDQKRGKSASHIAEYIVYVERNEPAIFVLLQNIFFGRLYLSMLRTRTEYSSDVKMDPTAVYLDTNIVMSLLGLHEKEDCELASELLGILLSAKNIEPCVFSATVDEARRLLESYQSESMNYTKNIRVNTIHSVLKRQGFDRYRIDLLIESLEDKIEELGIEVKDLPFTVETNQYHEMRTEIDTWAKLLESPKGQKTLDHDANVIYGISCLRNGVRTKLFEKCHAVFVSPDRAIHEVTQEISSKDSRFPLSMLPLDIVSMLWMRDIGNAQIATNILRQSVMAYVREKAITHKLWDTFIFVLKEAQGQEKLSKDDVALILASDDTSRLLAEKQYEAPKEIIDSKYIAELRTQRKKLRESALHGENIIVNIRGRMHRVSYAFATVTVAIAIIVPLALVASILYFFTSQVGIDKFASIATLVVIFVPLVVVFLFGKEMRLTSLVISLRRRLHNRMYLMFQNWLEKFITGEHLDEEST